MRPGRTLFGWRRRYWTFLLKLAKARPSWTIQAQPGPAVGPFHWSNRRLSTRELCRLQTFPDDAIISGNRTSVQRQLGNAVPSLLAEVLGRAIRVQLLGLPAMRGAPKLLPPRRKDTPLPSPTPTCPRSFARSRASTLRIRAPASDTAPCCAPRRVNSDRALRDAPGRPPGSSLQSHCSHKARRTPSSGAQASPLREGLPRCDDRVRHSSESSQPSTGRCDLWPAWRYEHRAPARAKSHHHRTRLPSLDGTRRPAALEARRRPPCSGGRDAIAHDATSSLGGSLACDSLHAPRVRPVRKRVRTRQIEVPSAEA